MYLTPIPLFCEMHAQERKRDYERGNRIASNIPEAVYGQVKLVAIQHLVGTQQEVVVPLDRPEPH